MSYSSHQNPYYQPYLIQQYPQYQQIPMQPQSSYSSYSQPATNSYPNSNHNSIIEQQQQFPRPSVRTTSKASILYFNESDEELNKKKRDTSHRTKEQKPTTNSKTRKITTKLTKEKNNSSSEHEYRPNYSPEHSKHYVMTPTRPDKPDQSELYPKIESSVERTIREEPSKTKMIMTNRRLPAKLTKEKNNSEDRYRPIYSPEHPNHYVMMPPKPDPVHKVVPISDSSDPVPVCPEFKSVVEKRMRKEQVPIPQPDDEIEKPMPELNISGGIIMNPGEINDWQGDLNNHCLRVDFNPEKIERDMLLPIEYNQDIFYKLYKQFTDIQDGDITIKQEPHKPVIAPPLIVRVPAAEGCITDPVIIKEDVPEIRGPLPSVDITVPGDPYYLPRRVVKETFDKKPTRPSTVFIFKWLQFLQEQRNIKFEPAPIPPCVDKEHNLEIHWKHLEPNIKKKAKLYGICEHLSPKDYLEKNAGNLVKPNDHDFKKVDYSHLLPKDDIVKPAFLTGTDEAIERFRGLDLDTLKRHGLLNYSHYLRTPVQ